MDLSLAYKELISNHRNAFVQTLEGDILPLETWKKYTGIAQRSTTLCIYPGSFNPLHDGHRSIYKTMDGLDPLFETSIVRWQKPLVTLPELEKRLEQFVGYAPVVITSVARIIEKIAVVSAHDLVIYVGIDTLTRMREDYGEIGIGGLGARFKVFDRIVNGMTQTLYTEFPGVVPGNCSRGRERSWELMEISSTAIRAKSSLLSR